jgi:hypothetical protein
MIQYYNANLVVIWNDESVKFETGTTMQATGRQRQIAVAILVARRGVDSPHEISYIIISETSNFNVIFSIA